MEFSVFPIDRGHIGLCWECRWLAGSEDWGRYLASLLLWDSRCALLVEFLVLFGDFRALLQGCPSQFNFPLLSLSTCEDTYFILQ